jgi:hypothetical protein
LSLFTILFFPHILTALLSMYTQVKKNTVLWEINTCELVKVSSWCTPSPRVHRSTRLETSVSRFCVWRIKTVCQWCWLETSVIW